MSYTTALALKAANTVKTLLQVVCFSSLVLSTPALTAADEESVSDTSSGEGSAQEPESDSQANASGSQKRKAGDKGGVFLPSEDISEDVAITFPVDI